MTAALQHPGFGAGLSVLQAPLALRVSVEGEIDRDAWFTLLEADSEIVPLPRLSGGLASPKRG